MMTDNCPNCGRLTHLSVCIHCGISAKPRRQSDELIFRALDLHLHFRFPGSLVVFRKTSPEMAEVIPEMRMHPEAPRSGFIHPQPERTVHFLTESDMVMREFATMAGLIALELDDAGVLWFVFDSSFTRQAFLTFTSVRLDPGNNEVRLVSRTELIYAAGIHPSQFRTPFVLPLAVK